VYVLTEAPIATKAFAQHAARALRDHVVRARTLEVLRCRPLDAWSRPGESEADFRARLAGLADDRADEEAAAERARLEKRAAALESAREAARLRLEEAEVGLDTQKKEELIAGTGGVLGALFGGRLTTKSILTRASRAMSGSARERSQTRRAEARVESLSDKADKAEEALDEFEQAILDKLAAIDARWSDAAGEVERVTIPLERTDVEVSDLVLCWLPGRGA
jgi:hypothetical protein